MIALLLAALSVPAQAQHVSLLEQTFSFEDVPDQGSDFDWNDATLRWSAVCDLDGSGNVVRQRIEFAPVASGASLDATLGMRLPVAEALVAEVTVDGVPQAPVGGAITLLERFKDGFLGAPTGFVNTEGTLDADGVPHSVVIRFASPQAIACPVPDYLLMRDDLATPIDAASRLEGTSLPLAANFDGAFRVPREKVRITDAYQGHVGNGVPSFLQWATDVADGVCDTTCGGATAWWELPVPEAVDPRDASALGISAPLSVPPLCTNGLLNGEETEVDCGDALGVCAPCGPPPPMLRVSGGSLHTCAARPDGTVACWGSNASGRLGNGSTTNSSTPVEVSGLTDAIDVSAGEQHTCAVRETGAVVCWGASSYYGGLGNGTTGAGSTTPVAVSNLTDAVAVSVGMYHSCALRETGGVACWGMNTDGQLGDGSKTHRSTPVDVQGLMDAIDVSAGQQHTCAVRAGGGVVCWGMGMLGRLGHAADTDSTTPVAVSGLADAVAVEVNAHSCALRETGNVVCWGPGGWGQLGNNAELNVNTPVTVSGLTDALDVSTGGFHTCATRATGAVVCWGMGNDGRLGNGGTAKSKVPVTVSGLSDAALTDVGFSHSCAVRATGDLVCWGGNGSGQLGRGNTTPSSLPVDVTGF